MISEFSAALHRHAISLPSLMDAGVWSASFFSLRPRPCLQHRSSFQCRVLLVSDAQPSLGGLSVRGSRSVLRRLVSCLEARQWYQFDCFTQRKSQSLQKSFQWTLETCRCCDHQVDSLIGQPAGGWRNKPEATSPGKKILHKASKARRLLASPHAPSWLLHVGEATDCWWLTV